MATKKRNPPDTTQRNIKALKKQIEKVKQDVKKVQQEVKKKANK
jgi:hypothetical protein